MNNKRKIKRSSAVGAAIVAAGMFALGMMPAHAQEGVLYKLQAGDTNYCHLKFPAISQQSLSSDRPALQTPASGAIIDFYGPCNYDPIGKDAVASQKRFQYHNFNRSYGE